MSLNTKVLPPKKFQNAGSPYYDPIRHEKWFPRLFKRINAIYPLRAAYGDRIALKAKLGTLARVYNVNERQLRDYFRWREMLQMQLPQVFHPRHQAILDGAYMEYSNNDLSRGPLNRSFADCIRHVAALFGENPRPIIDLWELYPYFYPTGYPKPDTDL